MGIPTHEDAKLMLQLFRTRQEPRFLENENWFLREFRPGPWSEVSHRYPAGTQERNRLDSVLGYWELVGALIDHG
jgi:hypothetical protein